MELLVEIDIALDLVLGGRVSHLLLDSLQFLEIAFGEMLHSLARSIGFQHHAKPINFIYILAAKRTHDVTATLICGDQSICFKPLERISHGNTARPELGRKHVLNEPFASSKTAVDDRCSQFPIDLHFKRISFDSRERHVFMLPSPWRFCSVYGIPLTVYRVASYAVNGTA